MELTFFCQMCVINFRDSAMSRQAHNVQTLFDTKLKIEFCLSQLVEAASVLSLTFCFGSWKD